MPVTRYRDVRDMPPTPAAAGDLRVRIREVFLRAARLAGSGYPAGVHKFATIEAAQDARDRVVRARARALRAASTRRP